MAPKSNTCIADLIIRALAESKDPIVRQALGLPPPPAETNDIDGYLAAHQERKVHVNVNNSMGTGSSTPQQDETINLNVGTGDMDANTDQTATSWDQTRTTAVVLAVVGTLVVVVVVRYLYKRFCKGRSGTITQVLPMSAGLGMGGAVPQGNYCLAPPPFPVQNVRPQRVVYQAQRQQLEPLALAMPSAPQPPSNPDAKERAWAEYLSS